MSILPERPKRDIPTEIKKIIHKYNTSWETIEDLEKAAEKYRFPEEKFDIKNLEKELGIMEKLHSDLKDYERDHCKKSLHEAVEIAKHLIYDEVCDEYWVEAILQDRTVDDTVDYNNYSCGCMCHTPRFSLATVAYGRVPFKSNFRPVVETDEDVEMRLSEFYEELGSNRSMVLEARNLCRTLDEVFRTVEYSFIGNIKREVEHLRIQMSRDHYVTEEQRMLEEWKEEEEEARKLANEKLQSLCNVMKEVLGDKVENVVVSFEYSSSSCLLRDSGMGGKIMEIKANNPVIEDLPDHKSFLCAFNYNVIINFMNNLFPDVVHTQYF